MKKILFLFSLLFSIMPMNAQFTLEDSDGTLISDGNVIEFGVLGYPDANWDFYVNNTSTTDDIYMKILFESAVQADGSMMELCFGTCWSDITIGNIYPPNEQFIAIAPGEQSGIGHHLLNSDPGNGTDVIEYVFKYYQIDENGTEIGTPLRITYRYNPLLGIEDFNRLDVSILSTIIQNEMIVDTPEDLDLKVYDLQGRLVKSQKINAGQQSINMSDLKTQVYIVHFKNVQGLLKTVKVIVK